MRLPTLAGSTGPTVARCRIPCLGALQAVEIQQNRNIILLTPLKKLIQVWKLPIDEGRRWEHHPVAKRHSHCVNSVAAKPPNVLLDYPGGPVVLHPLPPSLRPESLHQPVLVHGVARVREVLLARLVVEQVVGHPRLQEEPVPQVHAPHQGSEGLEAADQRHLPQGPAGGVLVVRRHLVAQRRVHGLEVEPRRRHLKSRRPHVPPRNP
mmetsp:Transcript_2933/g.8704  ORF Transcript_2933/g.8704 Transcript_2933/m.8704 type:complete len:208 (+) Transcript_2933:289-912(+)